MRHQQRQCLYVAHTVWRPPGLPLEATPEKIIKPALRRELKVLETRMDARKHHVRRSQEYIAGYIQLTPLRDPPEHITKLNSFSVKTYSSSPTRPKNGLCPALPSGFVRDTRSLA